MKVAVKHQSSSSSSSPQIQYGIFINSFIGIVGEIEEGGDGYYIWTHKKFDIGYNGKQIVDVNLTSEAKVRLQPNAKIPFTYEVSKSTICLHEFCYMLC